MFRRSFMQAYQVRKYGKPAMQYGILSSNLSLISRSEMMVRRIGIYCATAFFMVQATGDFEIFYELFTHLKPIHNQTLYDKNIPAQIKKPNQQVIENFKKLHEAKQLMKTFEVE